MGHWLTSVDHGLIRFNMAGLNPKTLREAIEVPLQRSSILLLSIEHADLVELRLQSVSIASVRWT
ncbi:hypothetical protein BABINDRAFT_126630 [Babjeviella inositovora NRRL Y-12698]|uniref:Uncharacterized protein n=1 Tax=Babjeviella inositovora NRRL Y-12698 TaxID=984486 RepID=A0A1E3QST2_9ASCO|nr:uncharacterized protein BABINDRAFT_126630 [Babjeviella inositovora NRRL Y-12698]ODQ80741.1 hypothetical protein BABINDRAFT_126630 [Babjeviella inositovora NRRL Y-12698]